MNRNSVVILLILATLYGLPAMAQRRNGDPSTDSPAREKIRAAHAAYITRRLELTPEEAQAFWPLYNEFDEKRQQLREQWHSSRRNETDQEAMLEHEMKIKQQELDLEKEYLHRYQQVVPAEKLVRLRPAEADFRQLILRQVQKRRRN